MMRRGFRDITIRMSLAGIFACSLAAPQARAVLEPDSLSKTFESCREDGEMLGYFVGQGDAWENEHPTEAAGIEHLIGIDPVNIATLQIIGRDCGIAGFGGAFDQGYEDGHRRGETEVRGLFDRNLGERGPGAMFLSDVDTVPEDRLPEFAPADRSAGGPVAEPPR